VISLATISPTPKPESGFISSMTLTVNKRGRSATSAPYDAIKVTVKGIYNSGESFNTPASVHINVREVEKMKTTLTYFCWLCLLFGIAGGSANAQESDSKEGRQFGNAP
jgi:hypothetical protein